MEVNLSMLVLMFLWIFYAGTFSQGQPANAAQSSSTPPTNTSSPDITTTKQSPMNLRAVTLLDPPFVMMSPRGSSYLGYVIDVLNEATKAIGYTYTIENHVKDDFGLEERPGEWNGLIGQVQNKSADLAVAMFTITSKKSKVVSLSQPFMHAGFRALYKIPESWHMNEIMGTILQPFTPGLWVLLVVAFAGTSLGLFLIGRFSPYEDIAFVGKTATYDGLTLANSLLYIFSSMVWQGYTSAPKSFSGRILACIWWVFSVFTVGAYIAGLCVVLFSTNPEIRTLPFTTMDEMSRQSKVGIMVVKDSATLSYLNSSQGIVEKRILALLNINKGELFVDSIEKGLEKMDRYNGKYALLMDGPTAEYLANKEPCDKMVIGEPIGDHSYGFACRNDTDICDRLSTQILAMREDGRLFGLRKKWLHSGCHDDKPKSYIFEGLPFFDTFGGEPDAITPRTITIRRFSAAFIVLLLGALFAGLVLLTEIFWARRRGTSVPRRLNQSRDRSDDLERIENEFHDEKS